MNAVDNGDMLRNNFIDYTTAESEVLRINSNWLHEATTSYERLIPDTGAEEATIKKIIEFLCSRSM